MSFWCAQSGCGSSNVYGETPRCHPLGAVGTRAARFSAERSQLINIINGNINAEIKR